MRYIYVIENEINQFGYSLATEDEEINQNEDIIFSKRNQLTLTNKLELDYTINQKMFIGMTLRHYWSKFENQELFILNDNGTLNVHPSFSENYNINFNAWNIDLSFSYEFSPGSFLSFVWKNQLLSEKNELEDNFYNNIINTFDSPMLNSFSLKATYYLDYNNLKKKK